MKKFLALILVIAVVFCLCSCGNPTVEKQEVATEVTKNPVKMGLICLHDENSTYDANFISAFKEACENKNVEYLIKTNIGEDNSCYEAAADFADRGCSIVFADSFGHEDYIIQAAQEFPNVEFCHATGTQAHTEGLSNYHNAFASIYEGRFLDGVAAGMKLNEMIQNEQITEDEAKVGYVGAFAYAEVISGYSSFFLGVRYACPVATMEVTFTDFWYDETAEKEAANKLVEDGCVLISGHADSMGAPTYCESNNIPFVFYNGSLEKACPNTFIISTCINWVPYFEYLIDCYVNGEAIATDWVGTIETDSVVMTEVNERASAEGTTEVINSLIEQMKSGQIKVFDTNAFTVNGEHIETYMADVDTDDAYTPDTEAIVNGYFHESEFRSAPYFDLRIDGITLLDGV